MENRSKFGLLLLVAVAVVLAGFSVMVTPTGAQTAARGTYVARTPAQLKWMDVPDAKGVQEAVLYGDPAKGAHGAMNKFAASTQVPLHTHTNPFRFAVISGTLVITPEGQKPIELGPGSFLQEPGGVMHATTCKAGADCVIYRHGGAAFDVKMAAPK